MAKQFLTNLNLNKNELQNAKIQNLATAPSSPVTGQLYFNTGDGQLHVYDGTAWVALAAGGNVTEAINSAIAALDLENTYDALGAADTALADAKTYTNTVANGLTSDIANAVSNLENYADGLASNYDAAGAASTAEQNAKDYTNTVSNTLSNAIALAESNAQSYTDTAVAALVDSAPATLDTLNELAAALGDDPNVITNLTAIASGKQDALTAGTSIDITDNVISVVAADFDAAGTAASEAAAAQANAESYADTAAGTAYSNAVTYADGVGTASNSYAASQASNAYENAVSYVNEQLSGLDLSGSYDALGAADNAYSNAVTYVDGQISDVNNTIGDLTTDDVAETNTRLYFTEARARGAVSGDNTYISYDSSTGEFSLDTANAATVEYVDNSISDLSDSVTADITSVATDLATDYISRDNTLSTNLTAAYQAADNAVVSSLTQDFQDADNTVLSTLRSEISAASQGLDIKNSVRAASTANVDISAFNKTVPVDGVALDAGDRVLLKNQTDASENGIYVVGASAPAVRADDATDGNLSAGSFVFVEEGTVNADSGWVISTDGDITVGTTGITWTQFSGTGQIVAGNGITKTGSELSVKAGSGISVGASGVSISTIYAGQESIDTVGTITTGTWEGDTIDVAHGGTGATTLTGYVVGNGTDPLSTVSVIPGEDIDGDISGNAENVNGTVAIANGGTGATTAAGARANLGATTKYAENNGSLTPSAGVVTWTVSHSLNTSDVTVQMRDTSSSAVVEADITITDANTVTVSWMSASTVSADSYRVVVTG